MTRMQRLTSSFRPPTFGFWRERAAGCGRGHQRLVDRTMRVLILVAVVSLWNDQCASAGKEAAAAAQSPAKLEVTSGMADVNGGRAVLRVGRCRSRGRFDSQRRIRPPHVG